MTPDERFEAQVDRQGPIAKNRPDLGRCWLWIGAKIKSGYGVILVAGKSLKVHRWAYERFKGPIPPGLTLDHFACDNPPCCNPNHVRPATTRENTLRGDGPSAMNLAKTHCPAGHPYEGANLYVKPNGQRNCRTCRSARDRRRYKRRESLTATQ